VGNPKSRFPKRIPVPDRGVSPNICTTYFLVLSPKSSTLALSKTPHNQIVKEFPNNVKKLERRNAAYRSAWAEFAGYQ
jgi:hypothetical protein